MYERAGAPLVSHRRTSSELTTTQVCATLRRAGRTEELVFERVKRAQPREIAPERLEARRRAQLCGELAGRARRRRREQRRQVAEHERVHLKRPAQHNTYHEFGQHQSQAVTNSHKAHDLCTVLYCIVLLTTNSSAHLSPHRKSDEAFSRSRLRSSRQRIPRPVNCSGILANTEKSNKLWLSSNNILQDEIALRQMRITIQS